ncbi:hydrolase 1, exosortase A system-associated [Pseudoduganella buxea]|uniref:Hydrolase 1, exosortase A system-associated n=1 Tax=Pseudoduganella buxea TaxID=1949069 RepID=A0A6I3T4B9_9BURK|nr:hydrolase 1, exosortase A system-associated [Pseudoduganella buxea]MTV56418.1 hydrolase 1, exosortase A system-associated [Pseudoduganella buxea]GGC17141.1 hydrolase 1, exosortase A system-associated [Pseudoduganella buxea]
MQPDELALRFPCAQDWLTGILSPATGAPTRGVLIVVGGPQYRAGSHRQFALLARSLAARGIPALRFDYRGMGDSTGAARDFNDVDADLRAAVDEFCARVPSLREVVIWGLCDAASAALFYAGQDARIGGLVLLNPWARTPAGHASATLKHYYRARLLQPELWKKLATGRFDWRAAIGSFVKLAGTALRRRPAPPVALAEKPAMGLHERMLDGMRAFDGKVLLIVSGNDLTAKEFLDMANGSAPWRRLLAAPRVQRHTLVAADHTFSRREWRDQVADWTADWVRAW